ncbi:MAG: VCBS repeat-containing protein [Bacteroidales bacterium]|nr:VCBS repeat-containing protein [Bacteroidales bacterium]
MRLFSFLIMLFFPIYLFSQSLNYINSSNGLEPPEWEGGNSEYEFADINNDGVVDIISMGDHGNPGVNTNQQGIMVWFGDGAGNWSVQMDGNLGYGGIAVGDVNNDGLWDIGYGIHHNYSSTDLGDQILEVALGDGTGTGWTAWDDGLATNGEDWGMFGSDFADIDNDGDLDLGSISFGCCAGVHVYANNMDGTWTQSFGYIGGNSNLRFVFGDINNDGFVDFIVAHQNGAVYFGDGTGDFINVDGNLPDPGGIGYTGPSLGDIDNDGDKDIAFVAANLEVWGWDQNNEEWQDLSGNLPAGADFQETQLWDMNADGFTDLAAYGDGTFTLWLGDGTGNWTQAAQFTTSGMSDCQAFRAGGDFDHNGFADMVIMAEGGSWPSYQNYMKCYREDSPADSLWIRGLFPKGHEVFYQNSVQFIDWASEVPEGTPTYVRLLFSPFGSGELWTEIIADYLPNSGRYQWTVPQVCSDSCRIRLIVWSGDSLISGFTTGHFTITGEPYVQAAFTAGPTFGPLPLEVQFSDLSTGEVEQWAWDFQNDGMFDSYEQNPQFTYNDAGMYSVKLIVSNDYYSDTLLMPEYILVQLPIDIQEAEPQIPNIAVSPNPFNEEVKIQVSFNQRAIFDLSIVNSKGEIVFEKNQNFNPDSLVFSFDWKGRDKNGNKLNPGIYILRVDTGNEIFTRKMVLQ